MSMHSYINMQLSQVINASHIEVINESHLHNVPAGSESHFKVIVVSDDFSDKMPVKRHQWIYNILAEALNSTVHALALHTYTETEWQEKKGLAPASPNCHKKQSQ